MRVLLVVPAYNEEENIEAVVDNLIDNYPQYDYVVVNDGSRDRTADICRKKGYHMIDFPVNLGLAGGFSAGMKYAAKMGYDYAVQIDSDGQHDPQYIEAMLDKAVNEKYDIVIGSRFVTEKKPHTARMLGNSLIKLAIRITTRTKIQDTTSGMRMFNREVIEILAGTLDCGPEPDTIAYLIRCGARVTEVQAYMKERTAGESYLTFGKSIKYMVRMTTSILFFQWFRKKIKLKGRSRRKNKK